MTFQITYKSRKEQRKYQSSAMLVWGLSTGHKAPVMWKDFPCHDVSWLDRAEWWLKGGGGINGWLISQKEYHNLPGSWKCWRSYKKSWLCVIFGALQWHHNERDGVSSHQHHDCLLNRLFRRKSKKTSNLRVTGLCVCGRWGDSPMTDELSAQRASNPENVSIWWRHHGSDTNRLATV